MKKFVIAAFAGLVAAASLASTAEAGHKHHHHHHGWGGPSFGLMIDTGPRYVERDYIVVEETCYTKRVKRYDAYGNRYYKRIRICD